MNLTAVLYLRPLTRSIFLRPYLVSIDSKPILAMMAERVLGRCGANRFVIIYHYESEREALEQAIAGTGAELRHTRHFAELQSLAEVAAESEEEQFAALQLGAVLAPADLMLRMAMHHKRSKNSYTLVEGVPGECLVSIYERSVLIDLGKISEKTDFYSPEVALRSLAMLGDRAPGKLPFQLASKTFDFLASYGVGTDSMPQGIFMRESMEFALVNQAVAQAREDGADPDSPAILRAIKQLQIRRKSQTYAIPIELRLKLPKKKSGRTRVLLMSPPSAFSGAEQALCSMVKFIDQERFELQAVVDHDGVFAEKLRSLGVQVQCPDREILLEDIERFSYCVSLYHELKPDIIHLNGRGTFPIVSAALMYGIPIVQHIRNGDLRGFENGMVSSSAILCISEYLKRETMRFPVRGDRVRIIYDEVDSEFYNPQLFSKEDCRREYSLDPTAPTVLMIARVVPNKRYDLMLQAAAVIRQKIPNLQLVLKGDIYGDSTYHRKIQGMVERLKLEECIHWMDFVPDIRTLIATADAMVLCSDREGLGSCVVEAQSMAVPVVVTNTGGTHEIVENGVSGGFVIPGNDYGHLAARLVELLANEELRRQLGAAGRQYVQTRLDARISARTVMEIYDGLMKAN